MKTDEFKIGIVSTAKILEKAVINPVQENRDLIINGIAARNPKKAEDYASIFGIQQVYTDYKSLIASDEVDIIYIPLANHLHTEWIVKAAKAQKHILVEKPICLSINDFNLIANEVKNNKVHLLEGLMVQHHPWQQKILEIIKSNIYGELKSIKSNICFQVKYEPNNYRYTPNMGGGVFWDLGIYWVQFIQYCIGLSPISIHGKSKFDGRNKIDREFEAGMSFMNNVKCELFCSYQKPFEASHVIEFENATLKVGNFLRPTITKSKFVINIIHKNGNKETIVFSAECFYKNQLEFFVKVLRGEQENIPIGQSGERIKILEEIYQNAKERIS